MPRTVFTDLVSYSTFVDFVVVVILFPLGPGHQTLFESLGWRYGISKSRPKRHEGQLRLGK
ncbi:hypothetical protein AHiyo6_19980 [Arthrobacter sp. Hiyo6]|nr:hypothetical protein AHiyo6_19980 [Arthrobacter sp. Hiyo6]